MRNQSLTIEVDDPETGDAVELELPTTWEICSRCCGEGSHVNPNIDGHGITAEEWDRDWDDDSREGYMTGRYDVACSECDGSGKMRVPDMARMTAEQRKLWREHERAEAQYQAEVAAERRYGC